MSKNKIHPTIQSIARILKKDGLNGLKEKIGWLIFRLENNCFIILENDNKVFVTKKEAEKSLALTLIKKLKERLETDSKELKRLTKLL